MAPETSGSYSIHTWIHGLEPSRATLAMQVDGAQVLVLGSCSAVLEEGLEMGGLAAHH